MTRCTAASRTHLPLVVFALLCTAGCTSPGPGDVVVYVYGEPFIEEGIPANEMADAWSVTFDEFVVSVDGIRVGGVEMPDASPIDIAVGSGGEGHAVASARVEGGNHGDAEFLITRVEARGSATRGAVTKTFDWVFDQPTRYDMCETTTRVDGGESRFEITVHADHLFYDSLVAEDPDLRFDALAAADGNGDDIITAAELAAADIGAYDPGSSGTVNDLWAFLEAQAATLGHVDGEGHCDAAPQSP